MEGLFIAHDECRWNESLEGDLLMWETVVLLRDIGPFKKGMILQEAVYNVISHELTLVTRDENEENEEAYQFKLKPTYEIENPTLS